MVQVHKEEQKPQGQLQRRQNLERYVFFMLALKDRQSGEILVASNQATRAIYHGSFPCTGINQEHKTLTLNLEFSKFLKP
ncbi:Uncharacterised protein [Legionella cincinnatiensis]|uniref:Uncharacterized protein n=1 Tax=Legionella cincinnatiensis TaxID=28085 RepID=A0A378ILH3_9GAMM|nr:Uncharacterised protein [Legionella cincinnatiensis]